MLLGCTVPELKDYLEKTFRPGMDWNNWTHKGWHIDHKLAFKNFDLSIAEHLANACHFSNLQPLWAVENTSKKAAHKWKSPMKRKETQDDYIKRREALREQTRARYQAEWETYLASNPRHPRMM